MGNNEDYRSANYRRNICAEWISLLRPEKVQPDHHDHHVKPHTDHYDIHGNDFANTNYVKHKQRKFDGQYPEQKPQNQIAYKAKKPNARDFFFNENLDESKALVADVFPLKTDERHRVWPDTLPKPKLENLVDNDCNIRDENDFSDAKFDPLVCVKPGFAHFVERNRNHVECEYGEIVGKHRRDQPVIHTASTLTRIKRKRTIVNLEGRRLHHDHKAFDQHNFNDGPFSYFGDETESIFRTPNPPKRRKLEHQYNQNEQWPEQSCRDVPAKSNALAKADFQFDHQLLPLVMNDGTKINIQRVDSNDTGLTLNVYIQKCDCKNK